LKAYDEIVLFYKQPFYAIFTKTFAFKSYLLFVFLIIVFSFFDFQKNDIYNYANTFANLFTITIIWTLFQIFIYLNFIPAFINLKKYKQLLITDDYIKINGKKYQISNLIFQKENHYFYKNSLSWTYLIIKNRKNDIVGKFIFEINNYKFFGISCDIILDVFKQKKKNIDQDYCEFIYNSIINEYLESKDDFGNLKKALFIVMIPLLLVLSIFIIFSR